MLCLSLLIGLCAYAQNKFQNGYFINNDGTKVEVLIKNDDWASNPTSFKYKISKDAAVKTGDISSIKEFSVGDSQTYIRYNVNIDRSSNRLNELSTKRTPEFKMETLFLRILVDGSKATLFAYRDGNLRRFFYKTPNEEINQLVYKQYKTEKGRVTKNELYKKQLASIDKCGNLNTDPGYYKNNLVKYFIAINTCNGKNDQLIDYTKNETAGNFRLKLKVGANYMKVDAKELGIPFGDPNYSSDYKINPRFGLELEYLLPFNNNRWGLFIEPSYQSFEGEAELFIDGSVVIRRTVPVDYKSVEIPVGVRHYFPLKNEQSRLFLNAAVIFDIAMNSTVRNNELNSTNNLLFGAGYEFNKLSAEIRYNTGRGLNTFPGLETSYKGFTLNLGYVIF